MTDSRFAGPPSRGPGQGDSYGYFSAPPAATTGGLGGEPPPPSGPGALPVANPFGGIAFSPQPVARAPRRKPLPVGPIFLVLVLIAGAAGAWLFTHRGDGLPSHLGPYARSTDTATANAIAGAKNAVSQEASGTDLVVKAAAYGATGAEVVLVEFTGDSVSNASGHLLSLKGAQQIGSDVCLSTTIAGAAATLCVQITGTTMVVVGAENPPGIEQVAAWTDQAVAAL